MTTTPTPVPTVAIIGCGKRGQRHAIDFAACGAPIVAVADPFPEAAQALSAQFGSPPVFTDHKKMLAELQPDMVSICTWPQYHCQGVLDAVEAGVKAIHCENRWRRRGASRRRCTAPVWRRVCSLLFRTNGASAPVS